MENAIKKSKDLVKENSLDGSARIVHVLNDVDLCD